jgi:hypothetical protein
MSMPPIINQIGAGNQKKSGFFVTGHAKAGQIVSARLLFHMACFVSVRAVAQLGYEVFSFMPSRDFGS